MAIETYKVMVGSDERFRFSADFAQASDPILLDGNATPFRVADARHWATEAARLLIGWSRGQGGELVGEDEKYRVLDTETGAPA
jgi:hypothetical protein